MTKAIDTAKPFKRRDRVYDSWWPGQVGIVAAASLNFVLVRWSGGKTWRYDRPHMKFLRKA